MLFFCSEIGMLSAVSWGNGIGSQDGEQIPERKEQQTLRWVLNMDPSYPRELLLLDLSVVFYLEFI